MTDQAEVLRRMVRKRQNSHTSRTIAITSGKGGVGKTNFSVNLALALINQNQRVALLDADLGLANADIILGIYPEYTISHVISGEKSLQDIIFTGPLGLKVLAGGSGVYDLANLNKFYLERFINSLDYLETEIDFLIVDTGAGISHAVLNFVLASDQVMVITTPEPTSITDSYGMIKTIFQQSPEIQVQLVVNLAQSPSQAESVWERLNMVARNFLQKDLAYGGYILQDSRVGQSVSKQEPFIISYPHSSASRCVGRIASSLLDAPGNNDKRGLRTLFTRLFKTSTTIR